MRLIEDILHRLREAGARPCHEAPLLRAWTRALPLDATRRNPARFYPAPLFAAFPRIAAELQAIARVREARDAEDGSVRLLVELADGQMVESVAMPGGGLCVSTQVGCAVGCVFCRTGQDGLLRQLGSAEIVAQVALARMRQPVRKVVFMGMGEPAHNLDNVLTAIDLLGRHGDIGHKNLVLSTVGDPRVFERLPGQAIRPALALSLHSTRADVRQRLLPRAPAIDPADLVALGEAYARTTGYPIQYQWTLLEGVNDGDDELDGIVRLLGGRYAIMNFIPYNQIDGTEFRRPPWERGATMVRHLRSHGILAALRNSVGQDVDGGCGQLRARAIAVVPRKSRPTSAAVG